MDKEQKKKFMEQDLPMVPTKDSDHNAIAYVNLVYQGIDKAEAFLEVFPERHKRIGDKARARHFSPKTAIMQDIGRYESGKYVQKLYKLTQEHYWSHFIDKRTKLLNKLADDALNDDNPLRDQHNAIKIFLGAVPEMKKEEKVVHEHKLAEDDKFLEQLQQKKALLYKAANPEEVIDIEFEELQ